MYDKEKSDHFVYYLLILNEQELKKEIRILTGFRKNLSKDYREVFDYIVGNKQKLSQAAETIYKKLLEMQK